MCNGSVEGAGAPHIVDNRGKKALPIGVENFDAVVRTGVYVDKTLLIRDLLDTVQGSTTLFCRPRRFGKSLAMRMLQCFFEAPVDGMIPSKRHLFENLAIWAQDEYYRSEQGAHPVIYLTLGGANGASWEEVRRRIANAVAGEYERHGYLYDKLLRFADQRSMFERLVVGQASDEELDRSLAWLSKLLHQYHGTETVILIDEYDRPITEGYLGGFREEATRFMRTWLTDALKGTVDLRLACVTGVQRVSKESIFSDLNSLVVDTPLSERHAESFGFTEAEAEALARYMGLPEEKIAEMRAWYDGYCFGGIRAYNPISTLRYLQDRAAQPYWTNTSGNAVVTRLFQRADQDLNAQLQTLAQGGVIEAPLNMQVVFGEIDSDTSAVWSQLYLGGYLTTDDIELPEDTQVIRRMRLPNYEVRHLFNREFLDRAIRLATGTRLHSLHEALLDGNAPRLQEILNAIVEQSPSFRDLTYEAPCHMLLMGMLYEVPGYQYPTSNRETGLGYSDILLEPKPENASKLPVIAIEVKRARDTAGKDITDQEALTAHAHNVALRQAIDKHYGAGLHGNGVSRWGVSFSGKMVGVAREETPA